MLAGELKDPRLEGTVVVSEVRVQPDMKHARVFVSMRAPAKSNRRDQALDTPLATSAARSIERLQLRRLPELHFTLDLSQEHVERIEQLLRDMKKDKPSSNL